MKTRLLTGLSLAINGALTLFFLSGARPGSLPASKPPIAQESGPVAFTNALPELEPAKSSPRIPPFQWSQVASDDLKVYRDNLRAVGCPELTVREIIRAEINELYGARRRAVLSTAQTHFWEVLVRGEMYRRQEVSRTDWGQPLQTLAEEREALIASVLGPDHLANEAEALAQQDEVARRRAWLPEDKRMHLAALEQRREEQLMDWAKRLATKTGSPTAEAEAALQQVQDEFEQQRKSLLTAEELEEFRLRESDAAEWPASVAGFEPTEDEWRAVTRLRLKLEEAQQKSGPDDRSPDVQTQQQNDQAAKLAEGVKAALGADRSALYEMANDPSFQQVRNVTQRFGLGDDLARQAYELQKIALNKAAQVRGSANFPDDLRDSTLRAIHSETEQALHQMFGPSTLDAYMNYGGEWLKELSGP